MTYAKMFCSGSDYFNNKIVEEINSNNDKVVSVCQLKHDVVMVVFTTD